MEIFYDCEFLARGDRVRMISIGMVSGEREMYAVSDQVGPGGSLHDEICHHDWLMKNVVPSLPLLDPGTGVMGGLVASSELIPLDTTSPLVMSPDKIRDKVLDFILGTDNPELWAWYGAYDHVVMSQLLGGMENFPPQVPMWTNDLKQLHVALGSPKLPQQSRGKHNALEDAKWNRAVHDFLTSLSGSAERRYRFVPDAK